MPTGKMDYKKPFLHKHRRKKPTSSFAEVKGGFPKHTTRKKKKKVKILKVLNVSHVLNYSQI